MTDESNRVFLYCQDEDKFLFYNTKTGISEEVVDSQNIEILKDRERRYIGDQFLILRKDIINGLIEATKDESCQVRMAAVEQISYLFDVFCNELSKEEMELLVIALFKIAKDSNLFVWKRCVSTIGNIPLKYIARFYCLDELEDRNFLLNMMMSGVFKDE